MDGVFRKVTARSRQDATTVSRKHSSRTERTRENGRARGGHWPLLLSQILNEVVRRRLTNNFGTSAAKRERKSVCVCVPRFIC